MIFIIKIMNKKGETITNVSKSYLSYVNISMKLMEKTDGNHFKMAADWTKLHQSIWVKRDLSASGSPL